VKIRIASFGLLLAALCVGGVLALLLQPSPCFADQCPTCQGQRTIPCPRCGGARGIDPVNCGGITGLHGCPDCGGVYGNPCQGTAVPGSGRKPCPTCGGTGQVQGQQPSAGNQPPSSDNSAERQKALEEQQKREQEEAKRKQAEFEKAKKDALRSMKGITENELGLKGVIPGDGLGLKGVEGAAVGELGLKGVGGSSVKTLFEKGDQNSAPVDTRVKGPSRLDIPGGTAGAPPLGLKSLPTEPAPQKPPVKPAVKPARVTQLSDADLAAEIARARAAMVRTKSGFEADVKDLRAWTRESQRAQAEAIKHSLDLLQSAMLDFFAEGAYAALPEGSEATRIRLAAAKASLELGKSGVDYAESAHQRQDRLAAAQAVLQAGYDFLSDAKTKLKLSEHGAEATALATFVVNYGYEATRWSVANAQIRTIIDGLGSRDTKGKLKAQQALAQYYKSLVDEQKRRKVAAQ